MKGGVASCVVDKKNKRRGKEGHALLMSSGYGKVQRHMEGKCLR